MSTYNRSNATFGSLAAAMGIIVVVLLAMALWTRAGREEHIPSVDYGVDADAVGDAADYTAYTPEDLPEGWVPTSSQADTNTPVTWKLGFATPEDRHAVFTLGDADSGDEWVAQATEDGEADGTADIGGGSWERYTAPEENVRSLMQRTGGAVLIVSGSSTYDELQVLARSLQPRPDEGNTPKTPEQ